jgi:hypothetical protein
MPRITEAQAHERADAFVKSQPAAPDYALTFDSIYHANGRYYLRYTKIFREPRKENPPYRLVVVEPDGMVVWGNP